MIPLVEHDPVLAGYRAVGPAIQAMHLGTIDVLEKPIIPHELIDVTPERVSLDASGDAASLSPEWSRFSPAAAASCDAGTHVS